MQLLKKLIITTILIFSFTSSVYASNERVAVISLKKIMDSSTAYKQLNEEMRGAVADFEKKAEAKNKELEKQNAKLEKTRSLMSPEAFELKREAFKKMVVDAEQEMREEKLKIDKNILSSQGKIQKVIHEVAREISKEQGFSLTVEQSVLVYFEDALNITDEVIKRLNKKLPKL